MSVPDQAYCETCRCVSLLTKFGVCVWCDSQVVPRPPRKKPEGPSPLSKMPEGIADEAAELYAEGRSLLSIARALLPRTEYANARTFAQALAREFTRRGIALRGPVEQSVIQSRKHERVAALSPEAAKKRLERLVAGLPDRPRCAAKKADGRRCSRFAQYGSDHCHMHNPEHRAEVARHVAAMHAARDARHRERAI